MCNDKGISIEDACKAIFSSISMKKAVELFNRPAEELRKQYEFTIQQNRDRIKLI